MMNSVVWKKYSKGIDNESSPDINFSWHKNKRIRNCLGSRTWMKLYRTIAKKPLLLPKVLQYDPYIERGEE
jgi:hypothetical protein